MSDEQKAKWGNTAMWISLGLLALQELHQVKHWQAIIATPDALADFLIPLLLTIGGVTGAYHGGSNGKSNGNGSPVVPFKAASILLALLLIPSPAFAQTIPGCQNGRLVDARAYVQSVTAPIGSNASNFAAVLAAAEPALKQYGFWLQRGANNGPIRGRIFLPYNAPGYIPGDPFYEHAVDLVDGNPPAWAWIDRGGPAYAPYPCATVTPTPTPTPDLTGRVERLENDLFALTNSVRDALAAQDGRTKVLESRKIPTGCSVSFLGCRLIVP